MSYELSELAGGGLDHFGEPYPSNPSAGDTYMQKEYETSVPSTSSMGRAEHDWQFSESDRGGSFFYNDDLWHVGGGTLYKLDPDTGSVIESTSLGITPNEDIDHDGNYIALLDGRADWGLYDISSDTSSTFGDGFGNPYRGIGIDSGYVAMAGDGTVEGFDLNGNQQYLVDESNDVGTGSAVGYDGKMFLIGSYGGVDCRDITNGSRIWHNENIEGPILPSDSGRLFIPNSDFTQVWEINPSTGSTIETWDIPGASAVKKHNHLLFVYDTHDDNPGLRIVDISTGDVLFSGLDEIKHGNFIGPNLQQSAIENGKLYVNTDGSAFERHNVLHKNDLISTSSMGRAEHDWQFSESDRGGSFFYNDDLWHVGGGTLYNLDPDTGSVIESTSLGITPNEDMDYDGNYIALLDLFGGVGLYDISSDTSTTFDGSGNLPRGIGVDSGYVAIAEGGTIEGFDLNGNQQYLVDESNDVDTGSAVGYDGKAFLIGSFGGVDCRDITDGSRIWIRDDVQGPILPSEDGRLFVSDEEETEVLELSSSTGETIETWGIADATAVKKHDSLLFVYDMYNDSSGLRVVNIVTGEVLFSGLDEIKSYNEFVSPNVQLSAIENGKLYMNTHGTSNYPHNVLHKNDLISGVSEVEIYDGTQWVEPE